MLVKSGASTDLWTIDPVSKAGRVSYYDARGVYRGRKGTYSASTAAAFVPDSATTTFFAIGGNATKRLRIWRVVVTGFDSGGAGVAYVNVGIKLMSTAPTGGTSTDLVQVPNNSALAAGAASLCKVYTDAPTDGTLIAQIASKRLVRQDAASAANLLAVADFDWRNGDEADAPVLNAGTAEHLAAYLTGAAATTLNVDVLWTYE